MYSGGACVTKSDQSCSSLPRQTNCGSRSRLRRSYATQIGVCSSLRITDWNSAVGMFLRDASSWVSVSTVLFDAGGEDRLPDGRGSDGADCRGSDRFFTLPPARSLSQSFG